MKVSIVVPVFDTKPDYLRECLDSLLDQSLDEYEIIVVDDGSTDPSVQSLLADYSQNPKVHIEIHSRNLGLPAARNTGLSRAVGEFVLNVDSDDFLADRSVLQLIYETAVLDGCDVLRFNGCYWIDGECQGSIFPDFACINRSARHDPELCHFRSIFCFLIRHSFLKEKDLGFDPAYSIGEDMEFLGRLLAQSTKTSALNHVFYHYRRDNPSMMRSKWTRGEFTSEHRAFMSLFESFHDSEAILMPATQSRLDEYLPFKVATRLFSDLPKQDAVSLVRCYLQDTGKLGAVFSAANRRLFEIKMHVLRILLHAPLISARGKAWLYVQLFASYRAILAWFRHIPLSIKAKWSGTQKSSQPLARITSSSLIRQNCEGISDYDLPDQIGIPKCDGLSVMYRVKNEAKLIEGSILSLIDLADQIVIVDNASSDDTPSIVASLRNKHPLGNKIELYSYPFEVARCGQEHAQTAANSVHSLPYFYNWALGQCTRRMVLKWDGDMIFTSDAELRKRFADAVSYLGRQKTPRFCSLQTENVYIDTCGSAISMQEVFSEVRLFSNHSSIYFTKGGHYEVLSASDEVTVHIMDFPLGYEVKTLADSEFDHWSDMSFVSPRKVQEFRTFARLKAGLDRELAVEVDMLGISQWMERSC